MRGNQSYSPGKTYWIIRFLAALVLGVMVAGAAGAQGLAVSRANPRYFCDPSGNAVYLTGSHTWNNFQDMGSTVFDFPAYLDFLNARNHNFIRLWHWEESRMLLGGLNEAISPQVYARTGPGTAKDGGLKFDLTQFNQDYFDRLRSRVIAARDRGIYVSVMLFDGWSIVVKDTTNPWPYHPYNSANNINAVNGDPSGNSQGEETHTLQVSAITSLQEAYIRKVVDTVNDLDNVLYEVSNETDGTTAGKLWQYHMIDYVKQYEATKPCQHPVGMTVAYPNGSNTDLFGSPADWVSPNASATSPYSYQTNPPASSGAKVIISDTDHLWGIGGDRVWAWKSFLRGMNVIYMDTYNRELESTQPDESLRLNMGYILRYAERMDLLAMTPQGGLASTGYCLAHAGSEYLVYAPSGGTFTVNLASASGTFTVEWFRPSTGGTTSGGKVSGGARRSFTPPFSGDAVLYLKYSGAADTAAPTVPTDLTASVISSAQINLSWTASTDDSGVAGYSVLRDNVIVGTSTLPSYQDKNLTPNTTYVYAVSAYDASGNTSAISSQVSAKTLVDSTDTSPPINYNIAVSSITRSSAKITWMTNKLASSQVEYGRTASYGSKTTLDANLVTSHTVRISGLSRNTTYHFRVYSRDAAGNLSISSDKWFTTSWW